MIWLKWSVRQEWSKWSVWSEQSKMIRMIKNDQKWSKMIKKTKNDQKDQKWSKWPSMIFFSFKIFLKSFWAFEVIFGVNIEVPDLSVVEVKITKSVISIFFSLSIWNPFYFFWMLIPKPSVLSWNVLLGNQRTWTTFLKTWISRM